VEAVPTFTIGFVASIHVQIREVFAIRELPPFSPEVRSWKLEAGGQVLALVCHI